MEFNSKLTTEYDAALTEVIEADGISDAISKLKDKMDEKEYNYTGIVVQDAAELAAVEGSEKYVYLVAAINDYDLEE